MSTAQTQSQKDSGSNDGVSKQKQLLSQLTSEVERAKRYLDRARPPACTPWESAGAHQWAQRPLHETEFALAPDGGFARQASLYQQPPDAKYGQFSLHQSFERSVFQGEVIEPTNQLPAKLMSWAQVDPDSDVQCRQPPQPLFGSQAPGRREFSIDAPTDNLFGVAQPRHDYGDPGPAVSRARVFADQPSAVQHSLDEFKSHERIRNTPARARTVLCMCRDGETPSFDEITVLRNHLLEAMEKKSVAIIETFELMEKHLDTESLDLLLSEPLRMNIEYYKINNELPGLPAERKKVDVRPSDTCVHVKGQVYKELDQLTKEDIPNMMTVNGKPKPSKFTIRWLRSHVRGFTLSGQTELANSIVSKFAEWFGQDEVDRAITDSFVDNLRQAANSNGKPAGDTDKSNGDAADNASEGAGKITQQEINETKGQIQHLSRSDMPGLSADGQPTPQTVTWLRWLFVKTVRCNLPLHSLINKVQQMFHPQLIDRVFAHPMIQQDIVELMQPRIAGGEIEIPVWYVRYVDASSGDVSGLGGGGGGGGSGGAGIKPAVTPLLGNGPARTVFGGGGGGPAYADDGPPGPRVYDDFSVTPGMVVGGAQPLMPPGGLFGWTIHGTHRGRGGPRPGPFGPRGPMMRHPGPPPGLFGGPARMRMRPPMDPYGPYGEGPPDMFGGPPNKMPRRGGRGAAHRIL